MAREGRLAGLDVLRLAALCFVTVQHVMTLAGHEARAVLAGLSIGQIGVALFLAMSGLLANESHRLPLDWLLQRMRRLLPAYWLAMAGSFILAWVSAYKHFDVWQVVCQLLCIGLFTHRDNLINTPTWFVSLLLLCYLGMFVAKLVRAPLLVGATASLVLAGCMWVEDRPWLTAHALAFSLAATVSLATSARRPAISAGLVCVLLAMAVLHRPAFGLPAAGLLGTELALRLKSAPRILTQTMDYSYEYFLVHGPGFVGAFKLLPARPILAVVGGLALSAVGAVALKLLVSWLEKVMAPQEKTCAVPRAETVSREVQGESTTPAAK